MANRKYFIYEGQKFNNLTVIKEFYDYDYRGHKERFAECLCDCGKITRVRVPALVNKKRPIKSCGCLMVKITHGQTGTPLYDVWNAMKGRVNNINNQRSKDYIGRGINMCKRWNKYENFMKWSLSHGYKKGLSIDRINNNGNYSPQNCRWTTSIVQQNNTRRNHIIEYEGEKTTMALFCRKYNLNYPIFNVRLQRGMSVKDAMIEITSGGKKKHVARYKLNKPTTKN